MQSYIHECRIYIQIHEYVACPLNYNYLHEVMHILMNKNRPPVDEATYMIWSERCKAFLLPDAPLTFYSF